jgi:hypothetical protein
MKQFQSCAYQDRPADSNPDNFHLQQSRFAHTNWPWMVCRMQNGPSGGWSQFLRLRWGKKSYRGQATRASVKKEMAKSAREDELKQTAEQMAPVHQ